ncbi:pentatricopeptide repeat-containing protein At5g27110-like [Selaginella moellendorffii]|uniref:pentatricopeptide repeat-containing protein At5g27110-like n=1 Tax=Selaginella moellendorffii TaxID=88036 RepID=UPI000D1C7305|nr:pentatricopeptide repeat-containing protein At5g27110-like [Selaginella moellendorffii]|eukprot:XP_024515456.1 pentatricopeptide repeat-containing protein At5g27110-like [Selaginella moellendorffii]
METKVGPLLQKPQGLSDEDALAVYRRMQRQELKPAIGIVVGALKVCRSMRDLQLGRRIHRDVSETGDFSNIIVANILLDLYAKCGSMIDARAAFNSMPHRDVVSWNSIIQGYAHSGNGDMALQLFARMEDEGYKPDRVSVLGALKACSSLIEKDSGQALDGRRVVFLERSREIHRKAVKLGIDSDLFVASTLIDLYAKCGSLTEARRVFEGMSHRSVVTWNCMILGYAGSGEGGEALDIYARMRRGDTPPDALTFIAALKACCCLADEELGTVVHGEEETQVLKIQSLEKGRAVHLEAGEHSSNILVTNTLVEFYAKCGSMVESRSLFDSIERPDVVSWNCLTLGYAQNGKGEQALEIFFSMDENGCAPDRVTVLAALKACVTLAEKEQGQIVDGGVVKLRALERGKAVHARALAFVDGEDLSVHNALVDMYAKCGSMVDAWLVFEDMVVRDVISWTGIILGYACGGQHKLVLQSFESMQEEGVKGDHVTATTAFKAVATLTEKEDGKLVKKWLEKGRALHLQVAGICELDVYFASVLVDMYTKCRSMEDARGVFDSIKGRDLVLWNSMILGYSQCGEPERALEFYTRLLQAKSLEPDGVTYVAVLKACASLAALDFGQQIHVQACSAGLDTEPSVGSSLVSFYGRCGSMAEAEEAFEAITDKTVVAWSALMAGYSSQGDSLRVFELFEAMKRERVRPDGVTFVSVLTACSHAGLVDKGREFFEAMSSEYGVVPNVQHYTCLVDLLCRANRLDEALKTVEAMPCKADAVLWTALLSSCLKWRDVELGRMAFQSVLKLDDGTGSAYSLMSNIYARGESDLQLQDKAS